MGSVGMGRSALRQSARHTRTLPSSNSSTTFILSTLIALLVLLGLLMVYSASYSFAYERLGDPNFYLKRQTLHAVIGLVLMLIFARIDHRLWMRMDVLFLGFAFLMVLATFVPGVASGTRWIRLGPLNLQPTEVLKIALIVYLSASLYRRREHLKTFSQGVWPHLLVVGVIALITIKQPDFGMALMFLSITYFLMFISGVRFKHLLYTVMAALPPLVLLMIAAPYRRARLMSFLDPFGDANNTGYQIIQSLVSLGSGGLWGRGLGSGVEKLGYLPAAHTDFIFSVLGEELGLWGAFLVMMGFFALGCLGIKISFNAPDRFGSLMAAGLTFALCWQALLNLGVAVGVLPVTGLTLPFVSYGGSSLLTSMAMVGMLISIARAQPGGLHE